MTHPTHRNPTDPLQMTEEEYRRWSDTQDDRHANSHAERQLAAYLDHYEDDAAWNTPTDMADPETVSPMPCDAASDVVTSARVLRDAARYLVRYGWCQGSYYDQTATVFTPAACVVGALGMVCYGGPVDAPALNHDDPGWPDFRDARNHLDNYLAEIYQVESGSSDVPCAYTFNDAKNRIVDEVIAALNNAADRWDRDHGQSTVPAHADYPHDSGTLYDCPACEAACLCTNGFDCVHCAITVVDPRSNPGGAA